MVFKKRKDFTPSKNFCVVCGRYTNDKKFPSENWTNQFFICHTCKRVWCGSCMGQVTGNGPNKTFKMGQKGGVKCPHCGESVIMAKLPANIPFTQTSEQPSSVPDVKPSTSNIFCKFCGEKIPSNTMVCRVCGAKQT